MYTFTVQHKHRHVCFESPPGDPPKITLQDFLEDGKLNNIFRR